MAEKVLLVCQLMFILPTVVAEKANRFQKDSFPLLPAGRRGCCCC